MDQLDMEILGCLQENARLSASKISRKVNLSISSVLERIHRMEEQGVIQRYTAIVDQTKLGRPLMMLMGVSMASPQFYERFERGGSASAALYARIVRAFWQPTHGFLP